MINNSILLGRVFGIPIRVHFFLIIALPFIMTFFSAPNSAIRLLGAVGLFVSVALHELGHSVVAQAKGSYIQEIILYPFGGAAKISNIPKRPMDEIQVALAGPAVSLLLAVGGLVIGFRQLAANPDADYLPLILQLGAVNLALFLFNLLPVFPMDGGRVLRAVLVRKRGRVEATRVAAGIGKIFCIFFVVYGLLNMQLLLAFIGGYIYFAGQQEYRMVLVEQQAQRFSGQQEARIEVEVSPPPYAERKNRTVGRSFRDLFRRR